MKVSRSKTEYLCINGGNNKETVKMEDTKVPRVKEFKYLWSTVQESGSCEREVRKRVQEGWNEWRKVWRVICDRRLPARVKGKVYSSVVRPAMVYGLETVAVTKKQVEETEVVWTCHEERPQLYRKKDDGNRVTGKEEKRETKEKIFRCSE